MRAVLLAWMLTCGCAEGTVSSDESAEEEPTAPPGLVDPQVPPQEPAEPAALDVVETPPPPPFSTDFGASVDVAADAWPETIGDGADLLILNGSGVVSALRFDGEDVQTHSVGNVDRGPAATVDGSWVVIGGSGRIFAVPAIDEGPTRTAWLSDDREAPFALVCRSARCLVARRGHVASVYMADTRPRLRTLHLTSLPDEPVEFIVRLGERVVAVDDRHSLEPTVANEAMVFGWGGERLFSSELPREPNEAIVAVATEGEVLWLLQQSEGEAPSNRLLRCTIRDQRFVCAARAEPILRPWIDEYTPLTGVAPAGRRAFVCAGSRGVLSVPMSGRVTRVHGTEHCRDVVRRGDRIYAIVSRGRVLSVRNLRGRETAVVAIGGATVLSGGPRGFAGP